jgi:hypothetical protein
VSERRLEIIAMMVAIFISALALILGAYTAHLQREQTRATVWPRLQIGRSNNPTESVSIENAGVGPAEVRSFGAWVDGQPKRNWKEVLDALPSAKGAKVIGATMKTIHAQVFRSGAEYELIRLHFDPAADPKAIEQLHRDLGSRLRLNVCYCSVLDECWLSRDDGPDQPTKRCDPFPVPFED